MSSDLPEVLHLSNRLYVMHHGRMVAELMGNDITEQNVLARVFSGQLQGSRWMSITSVDRAALGIVSPPGSVWLD